MSLALADRQKALFDYGDHRKHKHSRDDIAMAQAGLPCSDVSWDSIKSWVGMGFQQARTWAAELGMVEVLDVSPESNWRGFLARAFNYRPLTSEDDLMPDEYLDERPESCFDDLRPPVATAEALRGLSRAAESDPVSTAAEPWIECIIDGTTTTLHKSTLAANLTKMLNDKLSKDRLERVGGKKKKAKNSKNVVVEGPVLARGGFAVFAFEGGWYLGRVAGLWLPNKSIAIRTFVLNSQDGQDATVFVNFFDRDENTFTRQDQLVPVTYSVKSVVLGLMDMPLEPEVTLSNTTIAAIDEAAKSWRPVETSESRPEWPFVFKETE